MLRAPLACLALLAAAPTGATAQNWFQGLSTYPEVTLARQFAAVGDFDEDGLPDVLTQSGQTVATWHNAGNGAVLEPLAELTVALGTKLRQSDSRVLDFNGNGHLDVVAWRAFPAPTTGLVLLRGAGDGTFTEFFLPLSGTPLHLCYGDFDGDGNTDVGWLSTGAFPDYDLRWITWDGVAPVVGGSATPSDVQGFDDLAAVDWDGDGTDDLVLSSWNRLDVWLGTGGAPAPLGFVQTDLTGASRLELVDGDLNGDGAGDLLAVESYDLFTELSQLYLGQAGAAVVAQPAGDVGGVLPGNTEAVDWDGDGDLDLVSNGVIGNEGVSVAENTDGVTFDVKLNVVGGANGNIGGVDDLDGDGHMDLVLPVAVLFGDGSFVRPWPLSTTSAANVTFADREGDGDTDRLSFSFAGAAELNDGTGDFPSSVPFPTPPDGFAYRDFVGLDDFTGDGRLDFVCAFETQPDDIFEPPIFKEMRLLADDGLGGYVDLGAAAIAGLDMQAVGPFGPVAADYGSADLDGDGDLEIYGAATVWENIGGPAAPLFTTPIQPVTQNIVAAGDLDGDDLPELITILPGTPDALRVEYNQGGLAFQTHIVFTHPELVPPAKLLDLDDDGDLDLAISSRLPSRIHLYENQSGLLVLAAQLDANLAGTATTFALEDVNADGAKDLVLGRNTFDTAWDHQHAVLLGSGVPYDFAGVAAWDAGPIAAFVDGDGDGDRDAYNTFGMVVNRRYDGPESIHQYGLGSPGSGGARPVLGATGPLRVGETTASLRLVLALGGVPGVLAISTGTAELTDFPFVGLTTLVSLSPLVTLPLTTSPGGAGEGTWTLPFGINPNLAGQTTTNQVFLFDPASPSLLSHSNGVATSFGP